MDNLISWDQKLFVLINQSWASDLQSAVFPVLTDFHQNIWAQFLIIPLLFGGWFALQRKKAIRILLLIILAVGLSDAFSYRVIKSFIKRPRPAYSGIPVELRTHDHTGPSFPSNHSANSFAAGVLLALSIPKLAPIFLILAGAIAYSRVYVGVHFPFDALGGALIGSTIALLIWLNLRRWIEGAAHSKYLTWIEDQRTPKHENASA